jgi:hypothetical protein
MQGAVAQQCREPCKRLQHRRRPLGGTTRREGSLAPPLGVTLLAWALGPCGVACLDGRAKSTLRDCGNSVNRPLSATTTRAAIPSAPTRRYRDTMKPMGFRSGQGAKRSDTGLYREHLQRRPGRKDTVSCFDTSGLAHQGGATPHGTA